MITWLLASAFAEDVHPDRILVRAAGDVVLQPGDRLADGAWVERELGVPGWYVVTVAKEPLRQLESVGKDLRIARARADRRVFLLEEPTDGFGSAWALENAPTLGGTFDADVDAADAWAQGARGDGVVVAVVDTGVDLAHPELAGALWTNPGEIGGNGVDDDGNGYVDDVHGVDVAARSGDARDDVGHGTAIAGLIAAADDDQGAVGLAPQARIMAVRIFTDEGSYESTAAEGVAYAAREGADVVSCSWQSGQTESDLVSDAIALARDRGALVVVSAGNEALDADENGFWPAKSADAAVISVGASDRDDAIVRLDGIWGSAYGDETVDLLAPGAVLLTTGIDGEHQYFWGTSAAAPLVSATAALVWSARPELTADEVKAAILDGVDPNGSETVTGGRLNAGNAVRLAMGGGGPLDVGISGPLPSAPGESVVWSIPPEAGAATWYFPDDQTFARGAETLHTFALPGPWTVGVEVVGADGRRAHLQREVDLPIPWALGPTVALETPHSRGLRDGSAGLDAGDVVWTRLHFDRIDLARGGDDDYVAVVDADGHVVFSAGGSASDVWTPPLRGGQFTLEWRIADRGGLTAAWGFSLDEAQVWAPGLEPAPVAREGVAAGGNGCATSPGAPGAAAFALLLLSRRGSARSSPARGPDRGRPPR